MEGPTLVMDVRHFWNVATEPRPEKALPVTSEPEPRTLKYGVCISLYFRESGNRPFPYSAEEQSQNLQLPRVLEIPRYVVHWTEDKSIGHCVSE